jgi:hypothetical protein
MTGSGLSLLAAVAEGKAFPYYHRIRGWSIVMTEYG